MTTTRNTAPTASTVSRILGNVDLPRYKALPARTDHRGHVVQTVGEARGFKATTTFRGDEVDVRFHGTDRQRRNDRATAIDALVAAGLTVAEHPFVITVTRKDNNA
jgi:hypothetical protein